MEQKVHIELLDRFMRGDTSAEEERLLLKWFRNPASRDELFLYYKQKWEETSDGELPMDLQQRMFTKIKSRMREVETGQSENLLLPVSVIWRTQWLSYAAAVLICICMGIGSYLYVDQKIGTAREYMVSADKGQRASLTLPDGTKVWLNSHTEVKYGSDYGTDERIVSLTGEAYFEVAKDKVHRFVVRTGQMDVEAVGTAFSVKAYREDPRITASLFSGKVKVTTAGNCVYLSQGEQALFDKKNGTLSVSTPENIGYADMWRNNELAFQGETLRDIAVMLNRMYNVEIQFESREIQDYRFSGVIKNNSLDNVFELISLTAPIEYRTKGDTIILSFKKRNNMNSN